MPSSTPSPIVTGVVPNDLPKVKLDWKVWPRELRIAQAAVEYATKERFWTPPTVTTAPTRPAIDDAMVSDEHVKFALAISLIEQPAGKSLPCNNAVGMSPFSRTQPWAWTSPRGLFLINPHCKCPDHKLQPIGYAIAEEGQSDGSAVLFAFGEPLDSIELTTRIARHRNMVDGKDYLSDWVGSRRNPDTTTTDEMFDKLLARTSECWDVASALLTPVVINTLPRRALVDLAAGAVVREWNFSEKKP